MQFCIRFLLPYFEINRSCHFSTLFHSHKNPALLLLFLLHTNKMLIETGTATTVLHVSPSNVYTI